MISIVIPTYNEERIIGKTLQKLQSARRAGNELVVADGASADRTAAIAREHADTVVVEQHPEKRTIGRGRNLGAASARGDFFIFIDADVELPDPPAFLARARSMFEKDPALVGLTVVRELFGDENPIGSFIKVNKINFQVIGVMPEKGGTGSLSTIVFI